MIDAGEPVGVLGDESQTHQTAPVLSEERGVAQVEMVDDHLLHPRHVTGVGVVGLLRRLVALAEADEVGGDHPEPGIDQWRDHLAVEVAPRRFAMHREHDRTVGRALVEIVDTQRAPWLVGVLIVHLDVVRRERIAGQVGESLVGGSQCLHRVLASR